MGGAEFPGFRLLLTGDRERVLETGLRFRRVRLRRQPRDFSSHAMDLGLAPLLLCCLDRRGGLTNAAPSIIELTDAA